jgi:EpsI family protein
MDRAFALVLAVFAAAAFFPLARPTSYNVTGALSPLFASFPYTVGEWEGKDLPPDEKAMEILETRNLITREYRRPDGQSLQLLLVASRRDRRVAHPPEVCYTASNYNIISSGMTSIDLGGQPVELKEFYAEYERDHQVRDHVLYVYKVGGRYTTNYYAQQLQFAFDQFTRQESEVLLIRVAGADSGALKAFLEQLLPLLS